MTINISEYFEKGLLFVLLLPLFFLLHGINENFGLIPFNIVLRLSVLYGLITIVITLLSMAFLKKPAKAVAFTFYCLAIFFLFGAFHDFLKSTLKNSFFVSYSFLLPLMFVTGVVFFIYLKKSPFSNRRSLRYFYYLVSVFVALEIFLLVYNVITVAVRNNDLSGEAVKLSLLQNDSAVQKPDIFFVVLDSYASSECLKEEFDYDNGEIDSLLSDNHFFTSRLSRSNYNMTPFSLSSTFNLNYLKNGLENRSIGGKAFLQAIQTFEDNQLTKFLKGQGYEIKNYGCIDIKGTPALMKPYFADLSFNQIDNQTFYSRLMEDIGWNFTQRNIFTGHVKIPDSYKERKQQHIHKNNFNLDGLFSELKTQDARPKFLYVHLMVPHEPFYFDAEGKEVSDTANILCKFTAEVGYLNQVKYCNLILKKLIPAICNSPLKDKVVIIEGDHGFRDYEKPVPIYKHFMNLNTYYFSDGDYSGLYDGISPVNSFRVVLNKYFHQSLPMLKDSSIYLTKTVGKSLR
jgi:hypothetical protein